MKQEIIRLDQLTMGTIKYSDITLLQEKKQKLFLVILYGVAYMDIIMG